MGNSVKKLKGVAKFIFNEQPPQNEERCGYFGAALATGNYPIGDECFVVHTMGGCGLACFVYQKGDCKIADEVYEGSEASVEAQELHFELYPNSYYKEQH